MQQLVLFDLDNTLICGDSNIMWTRYLWEQGHITDPRFLEADKKMIADYHAGTLDIRRYLTFSLQAFQHIPEEQIDLWLTQFVTQRIKPRLYPQAQAQLEAYRLQQIPVVIISATVSFIVKKIASLLLLIDVEQVIGVDVLLKDGYYSNELVGTPSFRDGKVTRIKQWLTQRNAPRPYLSFYTDSINDLPLCRFVDQVFTVNPDPQLQAQAQQHGWPVLHWSLPST